MTVTAPRSSSVSAGETAAVPGPEEAEDKEGVAVLALELAKRDNMVDRLMVEARTLVSAGMGMVELLQDAKQVRPASTPPPPSSFLPRSMFVH